MGYFYGKIGLKVTFRATLQNRKPQMHSHVSHTWKSFPSLIIEMLEDRSNFSV